MMAREVAVDVASHSPQVDPILDELTEALDGPRRRWSRRSRTTRRRCTTRATEPYCDAYYWVDNLRHTVRFAAAVQAALEDGFRVFAELSPHPLLTHAVDQTARSLDISAAALAACAANRSCRTGCAASSATCTPPAPRWTSPCCTPTARWWTRRCRRGRIAG